MQSIQILHHRLDCSIHSCYDSRSPISARILPAYFTDNYVSLLPGESREIEIEYPAKSANGPAQLALRGWNLAKQVIPIP